MPIDLLVGLAVFAAVTCFTPGPNNTMLMASGLNFGMRRTLPHVLGVTLGFSFMVLAVGLGIGQVLIAMPGIYTAMKLAAVVYLLWLAWGIATSGGVPDSDAGARPMTFLEACAFQWVNPKAWIMAVGATTSYTLGGSVLASSGLVAVVFLGFGLASSASWAVFGAGFRRLLGGSRAVRAVNIGLAVLLIASLYPVVAELAGAMSAR
jgi:threonine/homoserine/homoserine lactone efflux protein